MRSESRFEVEKGIRCGKIERTMLQWGILE